MLEPELYRVRNSDSGALVKKKDSIYLFYLSKQDLCSEIFSGLDENQGLGIKNGKEGENWSILTWVTTDAALNPRSGLFSIGGLALV